MLEQRIEIPDTVSQIVDNVVEMFDALPVREDEQVCLHLLDEVPQALYPLHSSVADHTPHCVSHQVSVVLEYVHSIVWNQAEKLLS